jgi:hypothetical protein
MGRGQRQGAIAKVLGEHGISASEQEIAEAIEEILASSGVREPYPDPRSLLNAEQITLLERGGFELDRLDLGVDDPIARAAMEFALMRATGLTTRQAAKRLGVNDSRVRQRLGERALYGIRTAGEWRLPAFQFAAKGLVPGIDRVFPHVPVDLNPVAVQRWFHTPNPDLEPSEPGEASGRPFTPLEWLTTGNDPRAVADLAVGDLGLPGGATRRSKTTKILRARRGARRSL